MKIVVLDGYLLGFGGRSWEPDRRHGEFAYHDMTTAQDDVAAVIGNADARLYQPLSGQRRNHRPLPQS